MILVYVTCKDVEQAKAISKALLEKRLAACANFFPVGSMYWWEGNIADDSEVALILKTSKEKFADIEGEVKKMHSYECPCIISFDVKNVSKEYLGWLEKETRINGRLTSDA